MVGSKNILYRVKLCIEEYKSKTAFNVLKWYIYLVNEEIYKTRENTSCWHGNLTKIIPIVSTYIVLIEKEFLLKISSQIIRKQIARTYTTTFDLTSNMSLSLIWMNYRDYHICIESLRCLVSNSTRIIEKFHL
jgi:hypothetical protein